MGKINGTLYCAFSGSDKILYNTNTSLNVDVDLKDVTNKESAGWAEHLKGVRKWSIDFDGLYDEEGSGITPDEILAAIIARSADITAYFKPTSGATTGWTGTGTYKNIKIDAPAEGGLTVSSSIQGNGALAESA
jgi:predicted secreted protein